MISSLYIQPACHASSSCCSIHMHATVRLLFQELLRIPSLYLSPDCRRMLGKALWEGILLELPLAGFTLKALRGGRPGLHDLPSLDAQVYRNLLALRTYTVRANGLQCGAGIFCSLFHVSSAQSFVSCLCRVCVAACCSPHMRAPVTMPCSASFCADSADFKPPVVCAQVFSLLRLVSCPVPSAS